MAKVTWERIVVDMLAEPASRKQGLSAREISERCEISLKTVGALLRRLKSTGRVKPGTVWFLQNNSPQDRIRINKGELFRWNEKMDRMEQKRQLQLVTVSH
jgi:hypothetical protein